MQLIECQNLSKTYLPNTAALKGVTFNIGPAEFIVLAGPNGAGKTTLLRMLYGELQPTVGELKVNVPLEKVGVMPQEFSLFEELTVWEHTYYLALLKGIEKVKSRELAESVLTRLGLWNNKDTIVRNLSGGQKRLLCACQALTGKNDLLILDEPTIEVDIENRRAMYALLEESRNEGVSILYTTHFLDEIEPWVDRLILINQGQLLYDGPPSRILDDLYHSRIEIPKTERSLEFAKKVGLLFSETNKEINVFLRKDEVYKLKDFFDSGISEILEGIRITRPTLEEGYLNYLKRDV